MLEKEVVNQLNNYLSKFGIRHSNENRMGIGIPDISLNMGACKNQCLIDDYYMLNILKFVKEKHHTTINEIVEELSFSVNRVKVYVKKLLKLCLIVVKNKIIKFVKNIFDTDLGITIAIEVKLKDWRGGLIQAQRYLLFSDYSYLALPKSYIKNVNLEELINLGIGLLSVEENDVQEVITPKRSKRCDYIQKYILTSCILKDSDFTKKRRKDKVFAKYFGINMQNT